MTPRMTRCLLCLFGLYLLVAPAAVGGCKSSPEAAGGSPVGQTATSSEQPTSEANAHRKDDPQTLSLADRQRLWRCAVQSADLVRAADISADPTVVFEAVEPTLTPPASDEARFRQARKNWNVEWDPSRIHSWRLRWGHRGLELLGEADNADDVAEFLYRVSNEPPTAGLGFASITRTDADHVRFHFVEHHAAQSVAEGGSLASIMQSARQVGVDTVLERSCAWEEYESGVTVPSKVAQGAWEERPSLTTRLHRLRGWRARMELDVDSKEAAAKLAGLVADTGAQGVELAAADDGVEVTLYELAPRDDATFAPHALPLAEDDSEGLSEPPMPWSPTVDCEQSLCGVELDEFQRQVTEELLEIVEKRDQVVAQFSYLEKLDRRRTGTQKLATCLTQLSPRAETKEADESAGHATVARFPLIAGLRASDIGGDSFRLNFQPVEGVALTEVADELEACLSSSEALADVQVTPADEGPPFPLRGSFQVAATERAEEPPPWASTGELTGADAVRLLAEEGKRYQEKVWRELEQLKRELLIARDKLPKEPEHPSLIQRLYTQVETADGRLESIDHVSETASLDSAFTTHRLRLRVRTDGPAALRLVSDWMRMRRIVNVADADLRPTDGPGEPGVLDATLEVYSYPSD